MAQQDLKVRVTKEIKEFIKQECQNKGLSESKVMQLHFAQTLPFINVKHIKPKKK